MAKWSEREMVSFWVPTSILILFVLGVVFLGMHGCPKYNVWQKGLSGQAELKQAEWNRQITIREAGRFSKGSAQGR